jgi:hypothetical protein
MDISFRSTRNKWAIVKRYSEFYKIRRSLKKILKLYKIHFGENHPEPLRLLETALEAAFPRRHLRYDTVTIICERKPALESFVQMLVKVISCIPLSDTLASPTLESKKGVEGLQKLYAILKEFLQYPDKQIESENKLKLAVLSLEDVIVSANSDIPKAVQCLNECCSICLGEWDDEDCIGMNVVKLPCAHAFHEECLFEWLNGNTYCPVCRTEPGTHDKTSSDSQYDSS